MSEISHRKNTISLDKAAGEIDLSGLSNEAQEELRKYAAMKQIDLQADTHVVHRDLQATSAAVENMADATRRMSASGDAVTVRQTIENSTGKTEVLMGNTEEAKRGNVDKDNSIWIYAVVGVIVLLVIASVLGN